MNIKYIMVQKMFMALSIFIAVMSQDGVKSLPQMLPFHINCNQAGKV